MDLLRVMTRADRMLGSTRGRVMDFRICTLLAPQISPISSSSELMERRAEETCMYENA